jgi:mercuric ion binding protein
MNKLGIITAFIVALSSCAVFKGAEKETIQIATNAECGMCKDRIEGELNYVKGIVFAELDVSSKQLSVKYNSKKITLDEIRQKIAEIGYNADGVKADKEAQSNLPDCCQPGGMEQKK